ncbi:MAG: hypothetical protein ABR497_05835 [Kiritimatiellia bacterium]
MIETLKQIGTLEGDALAAAMEQIEAAYLETDVPARRNLVEVLIALQPAPEDHAWRILRRATRDADAGIAEIAYQGLGAPRMAQMREQARTGEWAALVEMFADEDFAAWPDVDLARDAYFLRGQAYYHTALLKPGALAGVIEHLLNAYSMTSDRKYLDRADHFGTLGMALFLGDGLPLPKATNRHAHYEAITGGPDFMEALLRLHEVLNAIGPQVSPSANHYLDAVRAYTSAMIESGRDVYGEKHTPLFAAALMRRSMTIGYASSPGYIQDFGLIPGVRSHDRSLGGANPQQDTALYGLLYRLTELTGDKQYAAEADRALGYFFLNCQSPATGLMAWGEHIYWDFRIDEVAGSQPAHEICGEWPFWDVCYRLAPEACWLFAIGQWDHQIADQTTGNFSRHAQWSRHGPATDFEFPRYAGQMIVNWADAYGRKENEARPRRSDLTQAIFIVVGRMEANMEKSKSGYLIAASQLKHSEWVWLNSNLELARCLWKAAPILDEDRPELAERMRRLAARQDEGFFKAPHAITEGGGFAHTLDSLTGQSVKPPSKSQPYTSVFATGYGRPIHANMANLCYARYTQLAASHPESAASYRKMILASADQYLSAEPAAWHYREAAKADLTRAVEISRWKHRPVLTMLGNVHRDLFDDRESAMARYLEVIENRAEFRVVCEVAGMMREDGDYDGALAMLNRINLESLSPGWRARILSEIARTLAETGRIEAARELYLQALELDVYIDLRNAILAAIDALAEQFPSQAAGQR